MRRSRAAIGGIVAGLVVVLGCELVVPSDVPDFKCASTSDTACPSGTTCDVASGKCVASGGGDDAPGDDGPGDDGPVDGPRDDDGAPSLLALGEACRLDGDCQSKQCGTSTVLTTTIIGGGGPICTQTCCTSADCPSAFVCFNGGTGGGYCVPAVKAQRSPPASGGAGPGASCIGSGDCRSGLCSSSRCVDTCCVATDCATGTSCVVGSVSAPPPAHDEWVCLPPIGPRNAGTGCTDNTQCKVNNCVGQTSATTCPNCPVCTPSCCTANDCKAWATAGGVPNGGTCAYGLSGSDQLKWCFPIDTARAALGATCNSGFDCQTAYCDPELKKCAQVCCRDEDCGIGEICKPSATNTPFLRCVKGTR